MDRESIAAWEERKSALQAAQAAERDARKAMIEANFNGLQSGSNTAVDEDAGIKLTVTQPENYSLDTDALRPLLKLSLTIRDGAGESGDETNGGIVALLREHPIVRAKLELNKSAYNKLTDAQRAVADSVLTMKLGTPQVSVTRREQ